MIRKNIRKIVFAFLINLMVFQVGAQLSSRLAHWDYLLKEQTEVAPVVALNTNHFYLLKSDDPGVIEKLQDYDLELVRRLDVSTVIVRKTQQAVSDISTVPFYLREVNNLWKLSPNLTEVSDHDQSEYLTIKSESPEALQSLLNQEGLPYKRLSNSLFRVLVTYNTVKSLLLPITHIIYIGKEEQRVVFDSRVLDLNLNPNRVNRIHHDFPQLRGEGLRLSIREGMFDITDMDIRTRDLPSDLSGTEPTLHATEMATIAAGAGNSSLNGKGVAGAVTLTNSLLSELLPDRDADYRTLDVWVQNHSYGTGTIENFYGAAAEAYDLSANNNPDLLHVFSAGNQGVSVPEEGAYFGITQPLANMTGNFKMSKNTLSVGSVDTVGREIAFVSKGPAHDGRIKPELVTYSMAGSSNSAAMVSGIAILTQQAYMEIHNSIPESALLKALLINSARDVLNVGPDYTSGYGDVDAYRAMNNLKANRFIKGRLATGENQSFELAIPANAINLKVTLVWNDPAATANANLALVNDLDLSITTADGQSYTSWVLNPDPDHLNDLAVRGIDRLNNVEQITIDNPPSGMATILVDAYSITDGLQEFFIAYQWDEQEAFEWSFPTGSDNMPYNGETVSYFRWESTLSATNGRLEYSIDNGNSWVFIDNVPLAQGYYRWDAPEIRSAALARMVVNSETFLTNEFTISRPERISVGFSCADSVRLQWRDLPEAEAYQILTFGDAFLEPISTVTDTSFTFKKSDFATRLFTVQPILEDGVTPVRAATFDYDFQGVGCYLVSFFAQALEEEGVSVNTRLGTTAGVSEIILERRIELGEFEQIARLNRSDFQRGTDFIDRSPFQGLNEYRAQIMFENGEQILTDVSSVYYLTSRPFLVFPNPLPRGEDLNVFSKVFETDTEVLFNLYNHAGLRLFSLKLNSDRANVVLDRLKPGAYFYRIITPEYIQKGRLILE